MVWPTASSAAFRARCRGYFFTDAADAPGALLASGSTVAPVIVDTGFDTVIDVDDVFELTVNLPFEIALAVGRAWFGVREGAVGSACDNTQYHLDGLDSGPGRGALHALRSAQLGGPDWPARHRRRLPDHRLAVAGAGAAGPLMVGVVARAHHACARNGAGRELPCAAPRAVLIEGRAGQAHRLRQTGSAPPAASTDHRSSASRPRSRRAGCAGFRWRPPARNAWSLRSLLQSR
jgi:hypothetical protein